MHGQAGKPAVNVLVFPTQTAANLALSSGRAQVSMADSPVAAYQVKQSHGAFKLVGDDVRHGAVRPRDPEEQRAAPRRCWPALKVLMKNGTYMSILTKWGIQSGAIPASEVKINGATS